MEFSPQRRDKIWEWSGNEGSETHDVQLEIVLYEWCNHTDGHRGPQWKVKPFTQTAFVWLEQNSLSGYDQVSSRLTAMEFHDTQNFLWGFQRKHSNVSHIRKSHSGWSRAHLAVSTEWVLSQTNESCLWKSSPPFTMGLYGNQSSTNFYFAYRISSCPDPTHKERVWWHSVDSSGFIKNS